MSIMFVERFVTSIITAIAALAPITRRRAYWATATGDDVSLLWESRKPREIRVHGAGDLVAALDDGTTVTLKNVPAGSIFVDSCWIGLQRTGSTAFAITVGW